MPEKETKNMKKSFNMISLFAGENSIGKKITIFLFSFLFFLHHSFSQTPAANFTASANNGCAPLQVTFTNTSLNASAYQWIFGDGNTSTVQNPSHIFVTPGIYNVKLIAQNSSGVADSFITTITVQPKPSASFQVSSTSACVNNNQFTFNNTSSGANTYLWDFGDGITSSVQNPSHTYSLAGNYSIKLIATNNFGCSDIIEQINHITIHPKPSAEFTSNFNYACSTSQTFIFIPQQNNLSYLWSFGDGTTSTLNSPSHNYSTPGSYSINLSVTDGNGCKDSLQKNNFAQVGSNVPAVVAADKTSGCPPLDVTFTASTPGMVATYWDFGNGNQVSSSNTFITPGAHNLSVTQIDNKGCAHVTQLNNYITVFTPPQASFVINDTVGCAPYTVQCINTSSGAAYYNWYFWDGTPVVTAVNPTHTYNVQGEFVIDLLAYSADGCVGKFKSPDTVKVFSPEASFTSNIQTGCAPLTVNFNSSYVNAAQILWDFGDGTTSTLPNPAKTYTQAGNYTISLIVMSSNGCADTVVYSDYIKVINPYNNYTPPPTKTGCAPFSVSFIDNTGGNSSVLWDFGDGTTSAATHPTHVYTTPGIYTVSLTTQTINGCTFNIPNYQTVEVKGAEANFSVNYTSCPPYIASFIDSSLNAVSWFWNFGDGNTSSQQNPTHNYGGYGSYNVSLTITTADGCSHTKLIINAVVFEPLSANFTWIAQNSGFPMTIDFIANSTGATSWLWDFGDGGTSTLENPTYTYQQPGQYTVTLTVSNGNCSITYLMSNTTFGSGAGGMDPGPGPGPAQQPLTGCAPYSVQFYDPTLNSVNWFWDFGDGTTSNLQDPVHTYFLPGIYDVTLIVTKISGVQDTIFMDEIVKVSGPVAAFNAVQSTNCQSTVVTITDQSTNAAQWNWDFGDGNFSSLQNPVHVYQTMLNNYSINLTATDSLGCTNQLFQNVNSGSTQAIFADKYSICKGDTVFFQTTLNGYSFYIWDFGDGNISFSKQPFHVYNNHGNYQVSLVVYSSSGCTFNHYLPFNINVNGPVSAFTVSDVTQGCAPFTVEFENLSQNYINSVWLFSDGTTSILNNPVHTFTSGLYDVTLIVENNGCKDSITETKYITVGDPQANFTFNQYDICNPSIVQFIDSSINAVTWNWDFGDGTTSQLQNPSHVYSAPFTQDITLTVTDSTGCSSTYSHPPLTFISGSFEASVKTGCAPLTVNFTSNVQNAASVLWLFGDGSTSTLPNPVHIYQNAGSYDVNLILISAGGCTDTITEKAFIGVNSPTADFSHTISSNCIPAVVDFISLSQNAVSWLWDFGDGTYSAAENPSKIYNAPGHFDVSLIVTNANGCTDTIIMQSLIAVSGPVTNFSIYNTSICAPVMTAFNDLSLNAVNWLWSFGDGTSDSIQNPIHIYSDTGIFTVTLIATDTAGCSAVYTMPSSIEVRPTAIADFTTSDTLGCTPYPVSFLNNSVNANLFSWTFGDGNSSNSTQPSYTYNQSGIFDVQLIATNQYGCADTVILNDLINVVETPVAEFTTDIINGCSPLTVQFTDQSTGLQNPAWLWSFNNGNSSTLQNPLETFITPGSYTITLTVTNNGICSSTITKPSLIIVNDFNPPAESPVFSVSVKSNSEVEITYGYVLDLDLFSYNVYRKNPATGNFDLVNTQYNINSTSFSWDTTIIDNNVSTTNNIYTYKIQTVDICGNSIPLENLPEYNTINVTASSEPNGVKVSWNAYGGCSVGNYNIYRNRINQTPLLIATVSPDTLEYFDNEILCPDDFSYKIEATYLCNLTFNSWSDTSLAFLPNLISEQKVEIIRSTVVDDQTVLTEWTEPSIAPEKVLNYNLYRSENNSNYQLIATLPAQAMSFTDINTDVDLSRYIYSVEVINICNLSGLPSNIGNSVLLKAEADNGRMILNWNGYFGWDSGVNNYKIERMDETGNWKEIGNVDSETRNFID